MPSHASLYYRNESRGMIGVIKNWAWGKAIIES
jgi:hypothetical protein